MIRYWLVEKMADITMRTFPGLIKQDSVVRAISAKDRFAYVVRMWLPKTDQEIARRKGQSAHPQPLYLEFKMPIPTWEEVQAVRTELAKRFDEPEPVALRDQRQETGSTRLGRGQPEAGGSGDRIDHEL